MGATTIEWCDYTFNPWRGCSKVSRGCDHCYAARQAKRNPKLLGRWGDTPRVIAGESYWHWPERWNAEAARPCVGRKRVFVGSMMDVFDPRPETEGPRNRLFALVYALRNLDWLLLTKRPREGLELLRGKQRLPPNLWVGVSVEDQAAADKRIPLLLQIPAAVRFVSCEPLLAKVNLYEAFLELEVQNPAMCECGHGHGFTRCPNYGGIAQHCHIAGCACAGFRKAVQPETGIHWVIAGGESGPTAQPCHPDWVRSLRDQCQAAGVPFLFKQWGEWCPTSQIPEDDSGDQIRHHAAGKPLAFVNRHSSFCELAESGYHPGCPVDHSPSEAEMVKVGKAAAGRTLDGREWLEFPTPFSDKEGGWID